MEVGSGPVTDVAAGLMSGTDEEPSPNLLDHELLRSYKAITNKLTKK